MACTSKQQHPNKTSEDRLKNIANFQILKILNAHLWMKYTFFNTCAEYFRGNSNVNFEIQHNVFYPHIESYSFLQRYISMRF